MLAVLSSKTTVFKPVEYVAFFKQTVPYAKKNCTIKGGWISSTSGWFAEERLSSVRDVTTANKCKVPLFNKMKAYMRADVQLHSLLNPDMGEDE
jgi:hypothetical protein